MQESKRPAQPLLLERCSAYVTKILSVFGIVQPTQDRWVFVYVCMCMCMYMCMCMCVCICVFVCVFVYMYVYMYVYVYVYVYVHACEGTIVSVCIPASALLRSLKAFC